MTATLGSDAKTVTAGGGERVELTYENGGTGLSFAADTLCYIDNVKVYTRIQEGELYYMDGTQGACAEAIRTLNRKLR